MSFIKEPKGVDFIIESEPLTEKDREEISKFIAEYKRKPKKSTGQKRATTHNKTLKWSVNWVPDNPNPKWPHNHTNEPDTSLRL